VIKAEGTPAGYRRAGGVGGRADVRNLCEPWSIPAKTTPSASR
jgi:hypothetical protein